MIATFPIKYYEDMLIFNNSKKECYALFKLNGFDYDFKSVEGKINILNALARYLANIGEEAKILIIPISQDIDTHYKRILSGLDKKDPVYIAANSHAKQTKEYLNRKNVNGNANDYNTYIQTKLKFSDTIIKEIRDIIQYVLKDPFQAIEEFLAVDNVEIIERNIKAFKKLANEYFRKQNRRIAMTPTNAMDIQWLIRRPMYRGIGSFQMRGDENNIWTPFSTKVIKHGETAIRPISRDILTLADGHVDASQSRFIKVIHGDGRESYQTFMPVAYIPDGLLFPGAEWLLMLQDYPVQTEVCINITTEEHKASIKSIGRKKLEIRDQIEHVQKSDEDLPDELLEGKDSADELEAELRATRSPMMRVSITLCLFSDSRDELEQKVNFIKEVFTDNNFIVERPIADQYKLFLEFFPGTGRYVTDYVLPLPPRTLAGGMIGATRLLGDNIGPYIGTTGVLKKNVYLDISRACKLNRSASAIFSGTLGGGKSFSANLMFYLACLYGGRGLVLDPKGERSNWVEDLPEFKGSINLITLSTNDEDKGKLDPFLIYKDNLEEAGYLAISILSEFFKLNPKDDEYLAILEAVQWVKKNSNPCMVSLANRLMDFPKSDDLSMVAAKMGRKIKILREMAMAGLLFGDGTEQALNFDKKINILQIQNLSMPHATKPKEDYTQEELLSTVLMLPIASFARRFIHMDRSIFKCVLFDEAWALKSTAQGRQMMNALIREGRALNAGCLFISQSTKDADDEGIKTNVSYKFCFKATDTDEIKGVLRFLDLEITDENIDAVKNLQNGECLFQDLDGRVGILKFDAVFEHLIRKAFNTNPDKKDGEKVEKAV